MKSFSIAVLSATLGVSTAALAAPDPTDARAAVPIVQYRSPFHDYRPLGDNKPLAWKAANDEVQRIGGWRAYAKEASEANTGSDKSEKNRAIGNRSHCGSGLGASRQEACGRPQWSR
ncbi:MAG: hypothetical protein JNN20_18880 [Betaproteobacteria bacterium]|nr:hypothetical protein [Betaproteobacteria bacterium]